MYSRAVNSSLKRLPWMLFRRRNCCCAGSGEGADKVLSGVAVGDDVVVGWGIQWIGGCVAFGGAGKRRTGTSSRPIAFVDGEHCLIYHDANNFPLTYWCQPVPGVADSLAVRVVKNWVEAKEAVGLGPSLSGNRDAKDAGNLVEIMQNFKLFPPSAFGRVRHSVPCWRGHSVGTSLPLGQRSASFWAVHDDCGSRG